MKVDTHIGIDNGVTGSIGILPMAGNAKFFLTPTIRVRDYNKKTKYLNEVDIKMLAHLLKNHIPDRTKCIAVLERPLKNPEMFNATISAMRAWQSTLNVLRLLDIKYEPIDSKEWQNVLLPGIKGSANLKAASLALGIRRFPTLCFEKDADGILIAHYAKLRNKK